MQYLSSFARFQSFLVGKADTQSTVALEISELQQQIDALTQEQGQMVAEKNQLQAQLGEQAEALAIVRDLRQQVENLTQEKTQLEHDKTQFESQLRTPENSASELEELRKQLDTLAQEKNQLQSQLQSQDGAVAGIEAKDHQVDALTQENNDLKSSLAESNAVQESLQKQVQTLIDLESTLQQQQTDAEDTLQQTQNKVNELQQQVDQLTEEKEAQDDSLQKLQADNERLEETIRLSKTTLSSLQQQVDTLTEEKQHLMVNQAAQPAPSEQPSTSDVMPETVTEEEASADEWGHDEIENDSGAAVGTAGFSPKRSIDNNPETIDLEGKSIVLTGTLIQLSPTQLKEKIQAVGGRVQGNPNSKTDYIVVGDNPGGKLQKAERFNVVPISESDILRVLERILPEAGD